MPYEFSKHNATMTVAELRAELDKYPDDMPVLALWEGQLKEFRAANFEVEDCGRSFGAPQVPTLVIDVEY